ncbi:hypothetical protein LOK49_LG07G03044 [Camellia lanceoleosa]|uniref:Uncharacterized protein n=1 Tax=Camellia lanceoleosa TaxID=1840588 RepID=A0ACC0H7I3_9ERIC|nr:hypothetical protein LOK49_LG07G03044 [Camellia lanceoleosa]
MLHTFILLFQTQLPCNYTLCLSSSNAFVYKIGYGIGTGKPDKTKGIVFPDAFILPLHDCTRKLFITSFLAARMTTKGKNYHHNTICVPKTSPMPLKVG